MSWKIFKREIKDTVFSKKYLVYLLLIYLPLILSIWFSYQMENDPSIIKNLTSFLPNPISELSPNVALMTHLDLSLLSIALVAILNASNFIAGERNRGIMPLLVSKPIKRYKIVFAKYFAFLVTYLPLLFISTVLMAASVFIIGIGLVETSILLAYILAALIYAVIYTNITTLISSLTKNVTYTNLISLIFLITWMTLDYLITYLPTDLKNVLEELSLSHHINKVIGYLTDGEAALFATGANSIDPTIESLIYTIIVLSLVLTILPLLISSYVFTKKDLGV